MGSSLFLVWSVCVAIMRLRVDESVFRLQEYQEVYIIEFPGQ